MKSKLIDGAVWIAGIIICSLIGAGMAILITKAIEQAKIEACFDYKKSEICEEVK